jgi:hypothetical protein
VILTDGEGAEGLREPGVFVVSGAERKVVLSVE